uniref:Large ribosomal subunit protein uL23m n=2 Tax=Cyprinus carpio TaxID=7962 RepID=A0A8C1C647_CYPCA
MSFLFYLFRYPLYQLGNPQLRIFRPTFNLALVRPGKEQPPDTVQFRIPMEMTKFDVRNYLEKIYSVPVAAVRTRIQYLKRPDYKVAYVQLVSVILFSQISFLRRIRSSVEEMQEKFMEDECQRQKPDPRRGGVTEWFGL